MSQTPPLPDSSPPADGNNPYQPPRRDDASAAAKSTYHTAPIPSAELPKGIPYIVGNEAAERFSFYGMKAILMVFMTKFLIDRNGDAAYMTEAQATETIAWFVAASYFFPLLGGLIADLFLGKYRTILFLSTFYCFGHLALALDETRFGLYLGLSLIAIGAGGIKPCVSAHVGDQFGPRNQHLLSKVFSWFYLSINLGAFASTLLTPWLLNTPLLREEYRPRVAFGVPGVLMLFATILFWMGRHKFVHIPARGADFLREIVKPEGLLAAARLCLIYLFVAMFWSLFDQTASAWIAQADKMDRTFDLSWAIPASPAVEGVDPSPLGAESVPPGVFVVDPSQLQAWNPLLILIYVPLFTYVVYPAINRVFTLTPLRKISMGLFLTVLAFTVPTLVQSRIDVGETPDILWQVLAYGILTAAEVMVSITCLEFSYTQAPRSMKSFIMSLYLLSVTLGNVFTALVNRYLQDEAGNRTISDTEYYQFFTGMMFVTACLFVVVAKFYRGQTYIHDEAPG